MALTTLPNIRKKKSHTSSNLEVIVYNFIVHSNYFRDQLVLKKKLLFFSFYFL